MTRAMWLSASVLATAFGILLGFWLRHRAQPSEWDPYDPAQYAGA